MEYEGISLIPVEIEDIELLNKWKNDENIYKYLGGGFKPISLSQQRKWIDKLVENTSENQRYIIKVNENVKVGFVGLYNISLVHRTCSLGLYIGEKEYWGQGIAKKAYLALEKYAKQYLNIRKIHLEVVEGNENAVKLYKKLGFKICGSLEQERYIDGKYENLLIMDKFLQEE
mgnify:FL=1